MIKFFRKLREQLLTENKFSKYLIYAIGEIILVVFGILIALQINNWNEQREKVQLEINILVDIKSDIQENIRNLVDGITVLKEANSGTLNLIEYYQNKIPYNDQMIHSFEGINSYWDPDFTYAAFQNLKSQGVNLISNAVLRKSLVTLHEVDMNILDVSEMNRLNLIYEHMVIPIQKKYFYRSLSADKKTWILLVSNYEQMIQDPEFYSVCTEMSYRQLRSIERFKVFNEKAKNVIEQIDLELNKNI